MPKTQRPLLMDMIGNYALFVEYIWVCCLQKKALDDCIYIVLHHADISALYGSIIAHGIRKKLSTDPDLMVS